METIMVDSQRAAMTTYTNFSRNGTADPYPLAADSAAEYAPVAKPGFGPGRGGDFLTGTPRNCCWASANVFYTASLYRVSIKYLIGHHQLTIFGVRIASAGENPVNWRRQLYGDFGHGLKYIDLFQELFLPSQSAVVTCDYTDPDQGSYQAIWQALEEVGMFDDLVATGVATPHAQVALLYSEAADIWFGTIGTPSASKRATYIALRHAGIPVDLLIDTDVTSGALNHFSALYVDDAQVPEQVMANSFSGVRTLCGPAEAVYGSLEMLCTRVHYRKFFDPK
jgi:hypothetical protein